MALQRQLLKKARICNYQNTLSLGGSSFSAVPSSSSSVAARDDAPPPQLPPFDHAPRPYRGPLADEVFQKRKQFLGPSLFHYYQKPVSV
jgi:alanine-glyoxylate transaminase/(R)-3-amino-2-methylpropionate-pyruvate transaminase